ncbi:MAG: DNA-binding protein [Paenibacillus sp.]|jgi:hypothetical protein|nr:DNA-binding protein [Paenibacillus sp.]
MKTGNSGGDPAIDLPKGLSKPAVRALLHAGYSRLEQLQQAKEADISQLHGMGPKGIETLRRELAAKGLSFAK